MNLKDSFASALSAILANKLRSLLTMLGVVIGVGSVIAMIGIGEGTKTKSVQNLQAMGTNMLMVFPNWRRGNTSGAVTERPTLDADDVHALKRRVPLIDKITGVVDSRMITKFGNKSHRTMIIGAEPQIAEIRNAQKMFEGGWYNVDDELHATQKAVLGFTVYQELFEDGNAVGATVKIKNQNFEVVGVIGYKGGAGMWNPDDQVYIPLSTAMTRLMGEDKFDQIAMMASDAELMPLTQAEVEKVLMGTSSSGDGEPMFRVMNQGDALEQLETQNRLLSLLLAGIASVSLLVGGIGIMNIMLVSVTERTREIGLRKAIGAKRDSILSQFLLESVVMCIAGGVLGILLGYLSVFGIARAMKVPPMLNTQAVILAFGFSAMVGLFFGLYPAMRASRLQPIEALRHD
jgi:putative ABC transport system permease protein